MTPKNKMAAQYVNIATVMKHFLVVFAASLVLTRIESEDIRGVNYPHEITFLHDYTLYREHDILFTSTVLDFGPPAIHVHVFLNSRIFRGVKPIFRLCPSLGSNQPNPPKLDFGSALFLILLSGQVELNPGPPMSGSLNLSSIFPWGYCEDPVTWEQRGICCDSCDMWFHKDCVDMGSFTFLAYSTTNVSWICCRCNHSNFDRNLFHSFEIETTNNFDNLNFSVSENVNSPSSDFAPTQHSSPIPPLGLKTVKETGVLYFVHVFLNSRIFRGVKPIFRLCPSLGSNQPSPPKLDFGSALFLILLSGQVELNPGPPMSGSLNLSSIFPWGYCEDPVTWEQRGICCDSCDMWFHKDCVDMGSFTFLAYSTTNVSWICCRCNHPNFDRNLFHSFEIETTNNFDNLNFSGSENVNSPNSDFAPTQHSSPIPPLGLKTVKETGVLY